MVMGFDTDIRHEGLVYHIQTEVRKVATIETTVYLEGAVVHCLKTDCRDLLESADYTEQKLQQRLEEQHRQVVGQLRAGEIRPWPWRAFAVGE